MNPWHNILTYGIYANLCNLFCVQMLVESISTYNVSVYFVSLICLNLSGVDFGNTGMASFIVGILRASPNLRMLETSVSGMVMY